jgi:hypothetical protein
MEDLLLLPPEYRPTSAVVHGSVIALGCMSGRVSILEFCEFGSYLLRPTSGADQVYLRLVRGEGNDVSSKDEGNVERVSDGHRPNLKID